MWRFSAGLFTVDQTTTDVGELDFTSPYLLEGTATPWNKYYFPDSSRASVRLIFSEGVQAVSGNILRLQRKLPCGQAGTGDSCEGWEKQFASFDKSVVTFGANLFGDVTVDISNNLPAHFCRAPSTRSSRKPVGLSTTRPREICT